jgi:hypothetical protein
MLRNNSLSSLLTKRDADKFKLILLQENGKSIEVQKVGAVCASYPRSLQAGDKLKHL